MRVQFHGLTYYVSGFCTVAPQKPHMIHSVKKFPVRGLETINFRNGTGNNNAHGIGHVVLFQCLGDGLLLYEIIFSFNDCFFLSCHNNRTFLS